MLRIIIYDVDPQLATIDAITDIMSILCINAADIKIDGQLISHDDMDEVFEDVNVASEIVIDPVRY